MNHMKENIYHKCCGTSTFPIFLPKHKTDHRSDIIRKIKQNLFACGIVGVSFVKTMSEKHTVKNKIMSVEFNSICCKILFLLSTIHLCRIHNHQNHLYVSGPLGKPNSLGTVRIFSPPLPWP